MAEQNHKPLLEIKNLAVAYRTKGSVRRVLRGVSLRVESGSILGVVGESGCGKTTLALAVLRYLPKEGFIQTGEIWFEGQQLNTLSLEQMRAIWGNEIAFVPQDPTSSLNPSIKIGEQVTEMLHLHPEEARSRVIQLFNTVQLADPERVVNSYPHQLSGGMQQRILIAMALSLKPKLLVLDEPTTNLDTTTQAAVLELICDLIRERDMAAIYVTHNLGLVRQVCDRVAILYAGELLEEGSTQRIFDEPNHPYTRGLLDSIPRLGENKGHTRLRSLEGHIPLSGAPALGCNYRLRCHLAMEICEQHPTLFELEVSRVSRCHRWGEIARGEIDNRKSAAAAISTARPPLEALHILEVKDIEVNFPMPPTMQEFIWRKPRRSVKAVGGVDFEILKGRTLGLVGESGSGKTTLARVIVGLQDTSEGTLRFLNTPLPSRLSRRSIETLRQLQMLFQNTDEALNPYQTVEGILRRALQRVLGKDSAATKRAVLSLLDSVHLSAEYATRLPSQLSGGERQRVAIARAFASHPALLIADEPVSSLDASVQAAVLNLLNDMQEVNGTAALFISHDLAVVGYLADVVAVIYRGQLMEVAEAQELFKPPYHPYTEALLSAIPKIEYESGHASIQLKGEIPSPLEKIEGCPFHTRCPHRLGEICVQEEPPWRTLESGKHYYCHIDEKGLRDLAQENYFYENSALRE